MEVKRVTDKNTTDMVLYSPQSENERFLSSNMLFGVGRSLSKGHAGNHMLKEMWRTTVFAKKQYHFENYVSFRSLEPLQIFSSI